MSARAANLDEVDTSSSDLRVRKEAREPLLVATRCSFCSVWARQRFDYFGVDKRQQRNPSTSLAAHTPRHGAMLILVASNDDGSRCNQGHFRRGISKCCQRRFISQVRGWCFESQPGCLISSRLQSEAGIVSVAFDARCRQALTVLSSSGIDNDGFHAIQPIPEPDILKHGTTFWPRSKRRDASILCIIAVGIYR